MSNCELLSTCPFFNDKAQDMSGMTERDKEEYCKEDYAWCSRYMTFRARQREAERITFLNLAQDDQGGAKKILTKD